ncbi:MAG: single-stranded DNA-binding protein [Rhizonema sp. NSF051]|nr:single-stranded DNA-binding protein [Rhizonema sp. NSF051]
MNNCILMAEIIQEPQLRFTSDNLEVTEMLVQFSALREGEAPATLKVIGWGNMAKEIQQNYHQGDRVLLEGRLSMNTKPHPEGFKEKRAELTVQKIHNLGTGFEIAPPSVAVTQSERATSSPQSAPTYESPLPTSTKAKNNSVSVTPRNEPEERIPQSTNFEKRSYPVAIEENPDTDDIPF